MKRSKIIILILVIILLSTSGIAWKVDQEVISKRTLNSLTYLENKQYIADGVYIGTFRKVISIGDIFYIDNNELKRIPDNPVRAATEEVSINSGDYDCFETGADNFFLTTSYLQIQSWADPNNNSYISSGLIFPSVNIADDFTISNAYIDIYVYSSSYDDANFKIRGISENNIQDFNTNQDLLDTRSFTTAYTSWVSNSIGTGWKTSDNITSSINEIIDDGNWSNGDDLGFGLIANTNIYKTLRFYAYEQDGLTYSAKLTIIYTEIINEASCPDNFNITQTGIDSALLSWDSMTYSDYAVIMGSYDSQPTDNLTGYLIYSDNATSVNVTGMDLNSTVYYFSLFNVFNNELADCYEIGSIGGDSMELAVTLPSGVYALIGGIGFLLISFFIKSPIINLAIIACMVGIIVDPVLKDMWLQAGCVLVMFWSALSFLYKVFYGIEERG